MIKSIIFHTIYQIAILFALVWGIEDWMTVDSVIKYNNINKLHNASVRFTVIFNAFVLMTLFNEINARKIHNEKNVFEGILNNKFFVFIWVGCFIGQVLVVNFGGVVFNVQPIDLEQWIWCIIIGVGSLLWGQLVLTIPDSFVRRVFEICFCMKKNKISNSETDLKAKQDSDYDFELEHNVEGDLSEFERPNSPWVRGSIRLQKQLEVIDAFQQAVDRRKSQS